MSINVSKLFLRFVSNAFNKRRTYLRYPNIAHIKHRTLCSNGVTFPSTSDNSTEFDDEFEENPTPSEDIHAIVGNDPQKVEALKRLMLEVSLWRQQGEYQIPEKLTPKHWLTLLKKEGRDNRLTALQFWCSHEKKQQYRKGLQRLKSERRSAEREKMMANSDNSLMYDLGENTLFHRIRNQKIFQCYDFKLAMASMFGPHIVIDCSYEKYMRKTELKGCALQIQLAWSDNRKSRNPFNIILCNVDEQSMVVQYMKDTFCSMERPETFLTITNKHYAELFPREKLVYLTPHCDQELEKYDHESVYIVGALVDERKNEPLSLANAKRENLRMAQFPIDKYLNWCQGSKLLPINQCVCIMNDLKDGACWQYAFRHIAPRKQRFHRFDNDIKQPKNQKHVVSSYVKNQNRKSWLIQAQHEQSLKRANTKTQESFET